jgi:hypothetical protein
MSKQNNKKRKIRFNDQVIRLFSKSIKIGESYPDMEFATTKLYNGVHCIFETTSGYVIGQGKTYLHSRNSAMEFLNKTDGKFDQIVNFYKL